MRILLLGEGNLTFSYALIKKLSRSKCFGRCHVQPSESTLVNSASDRHDENDHDKPKVTLVVTTFDRRSELTRKYPETVPILQYFTEKTRIHIVYRDGVDATRIAETLWRRDGSNEAISDAGCGDTCDLFDMIFFNNPHTGKEDLSLQHCLLSHFFASARLVLRPSSGADETPSQVVVSLCDEQPTRWGLLQAAARSGFACIAAVPFTNTEFPEFDNKRHQNDAKFPFQLMTHYYFVPVVGEGTSMSAMRVLNDLQAVTSKGIQRPPSTRAWEMWRGIAQYVSQQCPLRAEDSAHSVPSPRSLRKELCLRREDAALVLRECGGWGLTSFCMPPLHALLCYHFDRHTHSTDASDHAAPDLTVQECYSPLLPLRHLAALLLLQEDAMSEAAPSQQLIATGPCVVETCGPPPHLDAITLGRPLTSKEEAKLKRYTEKFPTKMVASGGVPAADRSIEYVLPFLTDPFCFVKTLDKEAPKTDTYCSCCGTDFHTVDLFTQHLKNLTPVEERFPCPLCPERNPFHTERALRQHQTRSHGKQE
ncbi:hypothetical protein STCU_05366 [Strigomonas culicis]|uniref:25S rRNA (uridine-N(3))-methyltransferase BMT5-like domain-containing protein n=1 Tax=Strigomonas culicis TaxID=28005 RepID=S9VLC3_9TRYP|nr:hypothetical protein STCU_05366 [Strigomonas culicis]|eukprot:EPY27971.1 hypothetical protein STCU_05366 [Strigomonas culicis]